MDSSIPKPLAAPDSEDVRESSTAPTTPGGSLSFSPALRPVAVDGSQDIEYENFLAGRDGFYEPQLLEDVGVTTPQTMVTNLCCVGAGYVGGPTAAVMAFHNPGIRITVVDRDETRIRRWNSAHPPIYEPGLADIVRLARDGCREHMFENAVAGSKNAGFSMVNMKVPARPGNLFFTTDVAESIAAADIVMIAVNTPTKMRGKGADQATDMASFEAVTAMVALHARSDAIIVEKSTVPCGTAEMLKETMAVHRPGVHFEVLSNPEFLAAGTAVDDLLYPSRVLIGSEPTVSGEKAAASLASVYAAWVEPSRILCTNVWSSELAKLVANAVLAQRISSINSIAAICERTGADVDEVAASVGIDSRIGPKFLNAGIGFGGSCFKKDILSLVYIAESKGLPEVAEYWSQVVKMNEYARDRFTANVIRCLNNTLIGKKITVLGYAFKKNTNDTRESPALQIIRTLLEERPREIAVFDPCCNPAVIMDEVKSMSGPVAALKQDGGPLLIYSDALEACADSNAVLITTDFDEFRNTKRPHSILYQAELRHAKPTIPSGTGPFGALKRADTAISAATASSLPVKGPGPIDPRPFKGPAPSEAEMLSLHKFLLTQSAQHSAAASPGPGETDPLSRFVPEPPCPKDCPDCKINREGGTGYNATTVEYKPKEQINWEAVAANMRKPKWVFDGRGVIDEIEMAKLGVKVESVGRKGRH